MLLNEIRFATICRFGHSERKSTESDLPKCRIVRNADRALSSFSERVQKKKEKRKKKQKERIGKRPNAPFSRDHREFARIYMKGTAVYNDVNLDRGLE